MSRVCAWILLLIFRLRVVLRGCASKFRSHGRRRVDFSLEVGRRCPCEAVRRNLGLTAGVASISPWKSGGVVLARPCVKVSHSRSQAYAFLNQSAAEERPCHPACSFQALRSCCTWTHTRATEGQRRGSAVVPHAVA
ncbi:hypothetical protein NDU88_006589 [Pleurodeles waltl]|uniref:Secreted protein n=1 Tax=Pleurodeles waltl TaxID=8319 RepID=A0AAV7U0W4_PLEWA|nr:hypothetical protein NDU88_006589 [Pleurodeles waltl]